MTAPSTLSERPLVSIVVTNYNYGRYLRAAIDSALAQTYVLIEVIAVDDGSTDGSREIIESFADRIVPVIKANGGHGSALNAGFDASRGEIVMFLDADDELLPEAAAQVVRAWRPGVAKAQFLLRQILNARRIGDALPIRLEHFHRGMFVRDLPLDDVRRRRLRQKNEDW